MEGTLAMLSEKKNNGLFKKDDQPNGQTSGSSWGGSVLKAFKQFKKNHPDLKAKARSSVQKHQQEEISLNSLARILQALEPLGKPLFSYRCTPVKQKKKYLDSLMWEVKQLQFP